MVERDEFFSAERHVAELADTTLSTAQERESLEKALSEARATLERAKAELPATERGARERRQLQLDAIRGRAELDRRLSELIENESLASSRRQQAEQRAQGFKSAAAFSSMARIEAESSRDSETAERELLVEERAAREGAAAEMRAVEEAAEEARIAKIRSEVAGHVAAEREIEEELGRERDAFERQVAELRARIERSGADVLAAEGHLRRLDADRDRLTTERSEADERLRELAKRARVEIEARIAELKDAEANLARERVEQERLLAALIESERKELKRKAAAAAAAVAAERALARAAAAAAAAAELAAIAHSSDSSVLDVITFDALEDPAPHAASQANGDPTSARTLPVGSSGGALDFSTLGTYDDAAIQAEVDAQAELGPQTRDLAALVETARIGTESDAVGAYRRALAASEAARAASGELDEQLIPGFRSFIGNMFTRGKPARDASQPDDDAEDAPADTSIADRIARDFGLLGTSNESSAPNEPNA